MKSPLAPVCRTLAVIIAIIGGLASFILLFTAGLLAFLISAFSVLVSAVPLFVLGDILDQLDALRKDTTILHRMLKDMATPTNATAPPRPQGNINAPVFKRTPGPWTCSCGQANTDTDQFCKNCGKYK